MDNKYFRNHAVYQIYPRSFADSNGDGIGDIPGIILKLDYLRELGIGIIWLSPVYKSPNDDLGYDISDYEAINPEYGTMEDMERLIAEARKRDIRIVMDLVVNHTSDEHRWFVESKKPDSPYRHYYFWREGKKRNTVPPNNWTSNFGGPAWDYDPAVGLWYLHLFSKKQPDLDWHNPEVLKEVEGILRFWLDKGIYGFRCDVINQIWKDTLANGKKRSYVVGLEHYLMRDGNHRILRTLHDDVFSHYDCMTVGETYLVDYVNARRFTDHELDMVFEFTHTSVDKGIVPIFTKPYKPAKLKKILYSWQKEVDWNANFFENHDQLRSIERFGEAKHYWKESGKMLATLIFTLRGTPYIYEGEEIGMLNLPIEKPEEYRDVSAKNVYSILRGMHLSMRQTLKFVHNFNRDNARSPMQWDDSSSAGFSGGTPWLNVNPNYADINVRAEVNDPSSILSYYKQLIALRRDDSVLSYGDFEPFRTSGSVMAFFRTYGNHMDFVLLNLTKKKQSLPKAVRQVKGKVLLSNYEFAALSTRKILRPYEAIIAQIR
jgi:oligo-1,6-glucosidase